MATVLLTEAEVAARLRCSRQKVQKLRREGRLPYLKGRPPLIDETDLDLFVERSKCGRVSSRSTTTGPGTFIGPKVDEAAALARARQIALRLSLPSLRAIKSK